MQTCTDKILYTRFYKAEIRGEIRGLAKDANGILEILECFTTSGVKNLICLLAPSAVNSRIL
jgi:hypothetical protein